MRFGHGQVGEQQRDGFAPHRGTAVGMQRELARLNVVLRAGFGDEALGKRRALVRRQHPADDVPAEDVEDHVETEVRPFRGAQHLRDIPAPNFVGTRGQELGGRVARAPDLIPPLLDLLGVIQDAVLAGEFVKFVDSKDVSKLPGRYNHDLRLQRPCQRQ